MCFKKILTLFKNPDKFYKDIARERRYWEILRFFVLIYFVGTVIQLLVSIPLNLELNINQLIGYFAVFLLYGLILAFLIPFGFGIIAHMGVLLMGSKKGFFQTFKPLTYGIIVFVVYLVFTSIISTIMLLNNTQPKVLSFITGIILLLGVVHMVMIQSVGVGRFHQISRGKAFFGIVLIPIIVLIVMTAMGVGI